MCWWRHWKEPLWRTMPLLVRKICHCYVVRFNIDIWRLCSSAPSVITFRLVWVPSTTHDGFLLSMALCWKVYQKHVNGCGFTPGNTELLPKATLICAWNNMFWRCFSWRSWRNTWSQIVWNMCNRIKIITAYWVVVQVAQCGRGQILDRGAMHGIKFWLNLEFCFLPCFSCLIWVCGYHNNHLAQQRIAAQGCQLRREVSAIKGEQFEICRCVCMLHTLVGKLVTRFHDFVKVKWKQFLNIRQLCIYV